MKVRQEKNKLKEFILTDGQTGYDVVSEYVADYWTKNYYSEVIVLLEISYNGEIFYKCNEIVYPNNTDVEFLNDWWEGQKYIKILGIISVDEVEKVLESEARCGECEDS